MATTKEYFDYVMDCLSAVGDVSGRRMMGGYLIYYRGKLIADICDNCLFVKQTESSCALLPHAEKAYPYEGSRTLMLIVDEPENTQLMKKLFDGLYIDLPETEKKPRKKSKS